MFSLNALAEDLVNHLTHAARIGNRTLLNKNVLLVHQFFSHLISDEVSACVLGRLALLAISIYWSPSQSDLGNYDLTEGY